MAIANYLDKETPQGTILSETILPNNNNILVKEFNIKKYFQVKPILKSIENAPIIAILNFKEFEGKTIHSEFKEMIIKKIKHWSDIVKWNIVLFDEDLILLAPRFIEIQENKEELYKSL